MKKNLISSFIFFLSAASLFTFAAPLNALVITIYHTSDVHGSYGSHKAGSAFGKDSNRMIGGYPALIAYIKSEAEHSKRPYILLDSGDLFQGTPQGAASKGMASAAFMNLAGYSAVAAGNHDLDYGGEAFKKLCKKLKAAMLSANLQLRKKVKLKSEKGNEEKEIITRPSYIKPYIMLERAGKRIAIIGLSHKNSTELGGRDLGKDISGFADENKVIGAIVKQVRKQEKPDAVILLNHSGTFGDVFQGKVINPAEHKLSDTERYAGIKMARLAKQSSAGVDLVLSGHEHTVLLGGYYDKISDTWFSETGTKLNYAGRADLYFDDITGKLTDIKLDVIPLWIDKFGEDKAALKLVKRYDKLVQKQMGKVIGYIASGLAAGDNTLNNPLANWTCEITKAELNAEVSIQNSSSFSVSLPAGKITLQDLYKSMKFDNTLYEALLPGEGLSALIAANFTENEKTNLYFAGLKIHYRTSPSGPIIEDILINGKPIEAKRLYKIVSNDYFVNVSKLGSAIKKYAASIRNTGIGVRETMQKNLEATLSKKAPLLSAAAYPGAYKKLK